MAKVDSLLASDKLDRAIPVLGLGAASAVSLTGAAVTVLAAVTIETVIRVAINADSYIAIGDAATATNASTFMPAGVEHFKVPAGHSVSMLKVSGNVAGSVTVMV